MEGEDKWSLHLATCRAFPSSTQEHELTVISPSLESSQFALSATESGVLDWMIVPITGSGFETSICKD